MVANARNFFGLAVAQSLVAATYLRAQKPHGTPCPSKGQNGL